MFSTNYTWSTAKLLAHTAECRWARRIAPENHRGPAPLDEALQTCNRRCKVCG